MFWGRVIRILIERGWSPPPPDERIVEDLLVGMEIVDVPNDPAHLPRDLEARRRFARLGLTPREYEIALFVEQGKTNPEIAAELGIKTQTVKFHLSNLYAKLGARNRLEAINVLRDDVRRSNADRASGAIDTS